MMALFITLSSAFLLRAVAVSLPRRATVFIDSRGEHAADPVMFIPDTTVPLVANRQDWTRGRTPLRLFKGAPPGVREAIARPGIPAFDPNSLNHSQEVFISIPPTDAIGVMCVPGHVPHGMVFYNVMDPELLPFVVDPSRSDFQNASVIIAPGGGNTHVAWEAEGLTHANWLNSLGISAFVLKYRVPENGQDNGEIDSQRSVILVRSMAKSYGLDPNRIGFMGSSAGGNIARGIALKTSLVYAPTDDLDTSISAQPDFIMMLYSSVTAEWLDPASVAAAPKKMFLAYTLDDPCIEPTNNKKFNAMVEEEHLEDRFQVVEYPDGKHAWGDCNYYPQWKGHACCRWRDLGEQFLRQKVIGGL